MGRPALMITMTVRATASATSQKAHISYRSPLNFVAEIKLDQWSRYASLKCHTPHLCCISCTNTDLSLEDEPQSLMTKWQAFWQTFSINISIRNGFIWVEIAQGQRTVPPSIKRPSYSDFSRKLSVELEYRLSCPTPEMITMVGDIRIVLSRANILGGPDWTVIVRCSEYVPPPVIPSRPKIEVSGKQSNEKMEPHKLSKLLDIYRPTRSKHKPR